MVPLLYKHPLLAYYALTFAMSSGGFLVGIGGAGALSSTNWQAEGVFPSRALVTWHDPAHAPSGGSR